MSKHSKGETHQVHHAHVEKVAKEQKILGLGVTTLAVMFVLLIATAVMATVIGFGAGASTVPVNNTVNNTGGAALDEAALKTSIEAYFAANSEAIFGTDTVILSVVDINSDDNIGGLYSIQFEISDGDQSQQGVFYANNEKVIVSSMVFDLSKPLPKIEAPVQTQPQDPSFTDEELASLAPFMECLATKGVKVYGANWCGYTKALVASLGGFEAIEPIYVECTEEEALCAEQQISGYPTVKLNGGVVNPARTIQGFADLFGCTAPDLNGANAQASVAPGSC